MSHLFNLGVLTESYSQLTRPQSSSICELEDESCFCSKSSNPLISSISECTDAASRYFYFDRINSMRSTVSSFQFESQFKSTVTKFKETSPQPQTLIHTEPSIAHLPAILQLSLKLQITSLKHVLSTKPTLSSSLLATTNGLLSSLNVLSLLEQPSTLWGHLHELIQTHLSDPHLFPSTLSTLTYLFLGKGRLSHLLSLISSLLSIPSSHALPLPYLPNDSLSTQSQLLHSFFSYPSAMSSLSQWSFGSGIYSFNVSIPSSLTSSRLIVYNGFVILYSNKFIYKIGSGYGDSEKGRVYCSISLEQLSKEITKILGQCESTEGQKDDVMGQNTVEITNASGLSMCFIGENVLLSFPSIKCFVILNSFDFSVINVIKHDTNSTYGICSCKKYLHLIKSTIKSDSPSKLGGFVNVYRYARIISNEVDFEHQINKGDYSLIPYDERVFAYSNSNELFSKFSFVTNNYFMLATNYNSKEEYLLKLPNFEKVEHSFAANSCVYNHDPITNLWVTLNPVDFDPQEKKPAKMPIISICEGQDPLFYEEFNDLNIPKVVSFPHLGNLLLSKLHVISSSFRYLDVPGQNQIPLNNYFKVGGEVLKEVSFVLDESLETFEILLDMATFFQSIQNLEFLKAILALFEIHIGHLIVNNVCIFSLGEVASVSSMIKKTRELLFAIRNSNFNEEINSRADNVLIIGLNFFFPDSESKVELFNELISSASLPNRGIFLTKLTEIPFISSLIIPFNCAESEKLDIMEAKCLNLDVDDLTIGQLETCSIEFYELFCKVAFNGSVGLFVSILNDLGSRVNSWPSVLAAHHHVSIFQILNLFEIFITRCVDFMSSFLENIVDDELNKLKQLEMTPIYSSLPLFIDVLKQIDQINFNFTEIIVKIVKKCQNLLNLTSAIEEKLSQSAKLIDLQVPIKPLPQTPIKIGSKVVESQDSEGNPIHPYQNDQDYEIEVVFPKAEYLTLEFDPRTAMEDRYDHLTVSKKPNKTDVVAKYSGRRRESYPSEPVLVEANSLFFAFHSDGSNTDWGFLVTVTAYGREDPILPNISWLCHLNSLISSLIADLIGHLITPKSLRLPNSDKMSTFFQHGLTPDSFQTLTQLKSNQKSSCQLNNNDELGSDSCFLTRLYFDMSSSHLPSIQQISDLVDSKLMLLPQVVLLKRHLCDDYLRIFLFSALYAFHCRNSLENSNIPTFVLSLTMVVHQMLQSGKEDFKFLRDFVFRTKFLVSSTGQLSPNQIVSFYTMNDPYCLLDDLFCCHKLVNNRILGIELFETICNSNLSPLYTSVVLSKFQPLFQNFTKISPNNVGNPHYTSNLHFIPSSLSTKLLNCFFSFLNSLDLISTIKTNSEFLPLILASKISCFCFSLTRAQDLKNLVDLNIQSVLSFSNSSVDFIISKFFNFLTILFSADNYMSSFSSFLFNSIIEKFIGFAQEAICLQSWNFNVSIKVSAYFDLLISSMLSTDVKIYHSDLLSSFTDLFADIFTSSSNNDILKSFLSNPSLVNSFFTLFSLGSCKVISKVFPLVQMILPLIEEEEEQSFIVVLLIKLLSVNSPNSALKRPCVDKNFSYDPFTCQQFVTNQFLIASSKSLLLTIMSLVSWQSCLFGYITTLVNSNPVKQLLNYLTKNVLSTQLENSLCFKDCSENEEFLDTGSVSVARRNDSYILTTEGTPFTLDALWDNVISNHGDVANNHDDVIQTPLNDDADEDVEDLNLEALVSDVENLILVLQIFVVSSIFVKGQDVEICDADGVRHGQIFECDPYSLSVWVTVDDVTKVYPRTSVFPVLSSQLPKFLQYFGPELLEIFEVSFSSLLDLEILLDPFSSRFCALSSHLRFILLFILKSILHLKEDQVCCTFVKSLHRNVFVNVIQLAQSRYFFNQEASVLPFTSLYFNSIFLKHLLLPVEPAKAPEPKPRYTITSEYQQSFAKTEDPLCISALFQEEEGQAAAPLATRRVAKIPHSSSVQLVDAFNAEINFEVDSDCSEGILVYIDPSNLSLTHKDLKRHSNKLLRLVKVHQDGGVGVADVVTLDYLDGTQLKFQVPTSLLSKISATCYLAHLYGGLDNSLVTMTRNAVSHQVSQNLALCQCHLSQILAMHVIVRSINVTELPVSADCVANILQQLFNQNYASVAHDSIGTDDPTNIWQGEAPSFCVDSLPALRKIMEKLF
ncbi:hypothetical protein P9112_014230 [Eukaryota sp. TZLM1-RC]